MDYRLFFVVILSAIGLSMILFCQGLKRIVGLNIFQTAAIFFFLIIGKVRGGKPPILCSEAEAYTNPLTQTLMLTAIVVGFALTVLGISILQQTKNNTGADHE